jgi:hypothetical protein
MRRHLVLPSYGVALVSTDLHGNRDDFRALERAFAALGPDAHWVIPGDVVHAPDAASRAAAPALYDYDDGSMAIVDGVLAQQRAAPGRVHFVLGNHDHGHVGGPHPRKFHGDEVEALEATLTAAELGRMRALFTEALLAVVAPCGAMLASVSRHGGWDLRVVIHGHDRDEAGFFYEGTTQLCPVIFGAPRAEKRYVVLDLGARYEAAASLRDGAEIRRLHVGGPLPHRRAG